MHKIDESIEGAINDVMIELSDLADENIADSNPILFDMKLRDIHSRAGQKGVASSFDVIRTAYDAAKANPVRRPEPVEDEQNSGEVGDIDRRRSDFWENAADAKQQDKLSDATKQDLRALAALDIEESDPREFGVQLKSLHQEAVDAGLQMDLDEFKRAYLAEKGMPQVKPAPSVVSTPQHNVEKVAGNSDAPSGEGETSGQTSKKLAQPGAEDAKDIVGAESDDSASVTRGDSDVGEVKPGHFVVE